MAANIYPIYTKTPNIGRVSIPTTNAQVKSNGVSAGSGTDVMYNIFTGGADGSYIEKIRFFSVASAAATTGVATTLRAYLSTIATPSSGTTAADTFLVGEVSASAQSSSHSTNATNYIDMVLNMQVPSGSYIHISQHVAQTTNQNWNGIAMGGDY